MSNSQTIFHAGSRTFYHASAFFPPLMREKITTVYAFVRIADNFVDSVPQKIVEFENFVSEFHKSRAGERSENSIIQNFVNLEAEESFPLQWTDAFLYSMSLDTKQKIYQTYEELGQYLYGSAEVIGLYIAKLLKLSTDSYPAAQSLGRAFQLINFIRDIHQDYTMLGRIYFPQEELEAFKLTALDKEYVQRHAKEFESFIHFQIRRFRVLQAEGVAGLSVIQKKPRAAILTATDMYEWTAKQIEKNPLVVLRKIVKPSKYRVIVSGLWNSLHLS